MSRVSSPLLPAVPFEDDETKDGFRSPPPLSHATKSRMSPRTRAIVCFITSGALNVLLLGWIAIVTAKRSNMIRWRGELPAYSPAQDAVTHNTEVFLALTERSKYHGPPTDEVDAAWEALYEHGISVIPESQAKLLANETTKFRHDEYLIQLDVFHILHCVNTLRKFAWPDRYPEVVAQRYRNMSGVQFDHIDHCINAVRESLMCSADVTPNVWKWSPEKRIAVVQFNNVHTCRDFEGISNWAKRNQAPLKFGDAIHTHGELVPVDQPEHHHHDHPNGGSA